MTFKNKMNPEKLKRLKRNVRTGGKGSVRRKKKIVRNNASNTSKRLVQTLEKQKVTDMSGVQSVDFIMDDKMIHFGTPRLKYNYNGNTYLLIGKGENKPLPSSGFGTGGQPQISMKQLEELAKAQGLTLEEFLKQLKDKSGGMGEGLNETQEDEEGIPDLETFKVNEDEEEEKKEEKKEEKEEEKKEEKEEEKKEEKEEEKKEEKKEEEKTEEK
ncbi:transcription factor btf3 family member [Anaeramoeba flamelloides]|uniref:Nascent polypeptide-associated complex subunit beta n=1 Tax=Anaeramoeba flamelloides TaxID=1746091 RepID=A0AAV7Y1Y5_9EUKA|nr:transcription factor btf3 family member [Anaeramoeba flamelloides]